MLQAWSMRARGAGGPAVRQHDGQGDVRARDTMCQSEHESGVVVNKGVEGKLTDEPQ